MKTGINENKEWAIRMSSIAPLESGHSEKMPSNFFKLFLIYNFMFSQMMGFHTWKKNYPEGFFLEYTRKDAPSKLETESFFKSIK